MSSRDDRDNATRWHGQRIVGERELDFHSDAQALRRRRRRQNLIFALIALLVSGVLVFAVLVFSGRVQLPGQGTGSLMTQPEEIENPQCPQQEFSYLEPGGVQVRVLNATGVSGLGGQTAELLEGRGFVVSSVTSAVSDYSEEVGVVVSGPHGYAQALSLQRHLPGALYVYNENMPDDQVDFEVGTKFAELTKQRHLETTAGTLQCANPPAADEALNDQ